MNIIQQAAEDYRKNTKYVQGIGTIEQLQKIQDNQYHSIVDHWHSYLSQQGDDGIASKVELEFWDDGSLKITELIERSIAIGRASNRWIPVTERLPEEKDAVEIDSIKSVEILWRAENYWLSTLAEWSKMKDIGYVSHWRTPSQYPEPPKSDI